jgi:hypothetical protein
MSAFEKLLAIADEEVLEKLREILTKDQIALALASILAKEAGLPLNQAHASRVIGKKRTTTQGRLARLEGDSIGGESKACQ